MSKEVGSNGRTDRSLPLRSPSITAGSTTAGTTARTPRETTPKAKTPQSGTPLKETSKGTTPRKKITKTLERIESVLMLKDDPTKKFKGCSGEKTDDELVAQAIARSMKFPLGVDDLFKVFGRWHKYYVLVILLNCFMSMVTDLHYMLCKFTRIEDDVWRFPDSNGTMYDLLPGLQSFSLENTQHMLTDISNSSKNDTDLSRLTRDKIAPQLRRSFEFGITSGALYCAYFHRRFTFSMQTSAFSRSNHRFQVLRAGVLFFLAFCLVFTENLPIIRMAVFTTALMAQAVTITVFMHLMQSLPDHLRPLGLFVLQTMSSIANVFLVLLFRSIRSWYWIGSSIAPIYLVSSVLYYFLCPSTLLVPLVKKQGHTLKREVAKWIKKDDVIDTDALIDDTMFRGTAIVYHSERAWKLLTIRHFYIKTVVLLFLMCSVGYIQSASSYGMKLLTFGVMEEIFFREIFRVFGDVLLVLFLLWFGRRKTAVGLCLTILVCLVMLFNMPMEKCNICDLENSLGPDWKFPTMIVTLFSISCNRALHSLCRLMLLEHIPVEQQLLFYPLIVFIYRFFKLLTMWDSVLFSDYPGIDVVPGMVMICIASAAAILLDDCNKMALTSAHFECYYFSRPQYPENPPYDDKTEFPTESTTENTAESTEQSSRVSKNSRS